MALAPGGSRQADWGRGPELGGLYVTGSGRPSSRRVDGQLRGRAGRQGDPGSSRFYLSLEDDLMRIFAGDRVKNLMDRMGMPDDEPIEHPWVTKSVVVPALATMRSSSQRICWRSFASRLESGSSIRKAAGRRTSPRASATRRRVSCTPSPSSVSRTKMLRAMARCSASSFWRKMASAVWEMAPCTRPEAA